MTGAAPTSPIRRVLANAGELLSGRVVNAIVGLAYIALTARSLGKELMGVVVLVNAFAQFLGEVAHFQSWQTLITYGTGPALENDRPKFHQVLRLSLLLDLISGVLGVALGVLGSWFFWRELNWPADASRYGALYALSIGVMTSATGVGLLRLFDRFRYLAGQQAVGSFVRMIGCAICALTHAPIQYFLLAWAAGTFVSFFYIAAIAIWDLNKRGLLEGFRGGRPDQPGLAWGLALRYGDQLFQHRRRRLYPRPDLGHRRDPGPRPGGLLAYRQAGGRRHGQARAPDGAGHVSRAGQDARLRRAAGHD
jgi:O-antigen/teichoic acid export membrane protein